MKKMKLAWRSLIVSSIVFMTACQKEDTEDCFCELIATEYSPTGVKYKTSNWNVWEFDHPELFKRCGNLTAEDYYSTGTIWETTGNTLEVHSQSIKCVK